MRVGRVRKVFAGACVLLLSACADNDNVTSPADQLGLALNKQTTASAAAVTVSLPLGERTQLKVTDARYTPIWSTSASGVATVDKNGFVTGVGLGSATVSARHRLWRTDFQVSVVAPTVATVQITPGSATIAAGGTLQLSSVAKSASGATLGGKSVTYSSSASNVATVSQSGLVTAVAPGSVTINAIVDGVVGTSQLSVSPPPVNSVTVTLAATTVLIGSSTQAVAVARDINGQVVQANDIVWSSSASSIASISPSGLASGLSAGVSIIRACSSTVCGASTITVAAPPSAPSPAAIALKVFRIEPGSSASLVSSAIPLPLGRLSAAALSAVRVLVNGQEVPVYVEALAGRHADQSLQSVLVQFNANLTSDTVSAHLELTGRTLASATKVALPRNALPSVVALPASPEYLVSTNVLKLPARTAQGVRAKGGAYRTFFDDFRKYSDQLYPVGKVYQWGDNALYDLAYAHFAQWVMTGEARYWLRGAQLAQAFRIGYVEANASFAEFWALPDGMRLLYWTTGNPAERDGVIKMAMDFHRRVSQYPESYSVPGSRDARFHGRSFNAMLNAWLLQDGTVDWTSVLRSRFSLLLQQPDNEGRLRYTKCNGQKAFMNGLLQSALVKYYENFERDGRLVDFMRRTLEFQWTRTWFTDATQGSFLYYWGDELPACSADPLELRAVPSSARGINGLNVAAYAWLAAVDPVESSKHRQRAQEIFNWSQALNVQLSENRVLAQATVDSWVLFSYIP